MTKNDVKYLDSHEWAFIEGNRAKIGISSYAAMHLGDIVFFDLPNVGTTFQKGDAFGAVESVKSASDLYVPLSGKVIAVNADLESSPELVNEDPFNHWLIELELTNTNEFDTLLDVDAYEKTLD